MLNLLNRGAGEMLSPTRVTVEELPPVIDVTLHVRCKEAPTAVSVVPDEPAIEWKHADGNLEIHLPWVTIQSIMVVEMA